MRSLSSRLSRLLIVGATLGSVTVDAQSLARYYMHYSIPGMPPFGSPVAPGFPPEVRVIGGGLDPAPISTSTGTYFPVTRVMAVAGFEEIPSVRMWTTSSPVAWFGSETGYGPCSFRFGRIPWSVSVGSQLSFDQVFYRASPTTGCDFEVPNGVPGDWQVTDRATLGAPVRRKAMDGAEYDASPMVVVREGVPWTTYYAGYRLGFVASESNWDTANLAKAPRLAGWTEFPTPSRNFELARLPRPWIEGEVVEYVNEIDFPRSPGGHYMYATLATEQDAMDGNPNWIRTGLTFKSGGYVAACRIVVNQGVREASHIYSADSNECKVLRGLPGFADGGIAFRAGTLMPTQASTTPNSVVCPQSTIPLHRAYNDGGPSKAYPPNHRYSTRRELLTRLSLIGWKDEGAVMCVPE